MMVNPNSLVSNARTRTRFFCETVLMAGWGLAAGCYTVANAQTNTEIQAPTRPGQPEINASRNDYATGRAAVIGLADQLERALKVTTATGQDVLYSEAKLSVARYFIEIADLKLAKGRAADAREDNTFLYGLLSDALGQLAGTKKPPSVGEAPGTSGNQVLLRDGVFKAGGRPTLLIGPMGHAVLQKELSWVPRFGFNVVGADYDAYSSLRMLSGPQDEDASAPERLKKSWVAVNEQGLALAFNPTLHYVPDWASEKYPNEIGKNLGGHYFPFVITSENAKTLISRYYAALLPPLASAEGFRITWLMNEPTYEYRKGREYAERYRTFLKKKYGSVQELNTRWDSEYGSFDQVEPNPGTGTRHRYDAAVFHHQLVSGWFDWLYAEAKKNDRRLVLSNKPQAYTVLEPLRGIDHERQAELFDVLGSDSERPPSNDHYAYTWRDPILLYAFQRSVAPKKALAELEFHFAERPNLKPSYVYAALWHGFLNGLRLVNFWTWDPGQLDRSSTAPAGLQDAVWSQPQAAWAISRAALDLRRLAPYVYRFAERASVQIYYGKPSVYLSPESRESVKTTFEAANVLGLPVGFVTDKMIREGKLQSDAVLIVPRATFVEKDVLELIRSYAQQGGALILIGNSLTTDEYQRKYSGDFEVKGKSVVRIGLLRPMELAGAIDQALPTALQGRLRLRNKDGNAPWPVESRCAAETDGDTICYVVGLNKARLDGLFKGPKAVKGWVDLISGKSASTNSLTVDPLDVRLLKLVF